MYIHKVSSWGRSEVEARDHNNYSVFLCPLKYFVGNSIH